MLNALLCIGRLHVLSDPEERIPEWRWRTCLRCGQRFLYFRDLTIRVP